MNPYDIGKTFIHNHYNDTQRKKTFQDAIKVNPAPKGHRINIPMDKSSSSKKITPNQFSRMPKVDKLQVWTNSVQSKNSQNIKDGKAVKHYFKRVVTQANFLVKKEVLRDPNVIENFREVKKPDEYPDKHVINLKDLASSEDLEKVVTDSNATSEIITEIESLITDRNDV